MYSVSEENYLKAVYHLQQEGASAVPTSKLADYLQTRAASVTEMVKKLADKQLLHYKPYYGVSLTETGLLQALMIIRKHRLWETFLVERLGFSWDEVHAVAEQLEHIRSEKLVNAIDQLLDHPTHDPHGDPIPNSEGKVASREKKLLSDCQTGVTGMVVGVKDDSASFLQFLDAQKITLGTSFTVIGREAFDDSMELELDGRALRISQKIAVNLYVKAG